MSDCYGIYKFWQPTNFVLYFCSFVKQPEGNGILTELQKVFEYFFKNVDRLLNMGSTQANASFNNIVASKHQKTVFMVDLSQLLLEWQQLCCRKTLVMMPFLRFVDLFAVMFMYVNIHKIAFCLNFHCINIQVIYIIKTFFIK